MFLLKSKRPAVYRENTNLKLSGPPSAPMSIIRVKFEDAKDGRPTGKP